MREAELIAVKAFYRYGYRGRDMIAILAPFSMSADASEIIGRTISVDSRAYRVMGVARQISGHITKGEPIGIEAREIVQPSQANDREPPDQ